MGIAQHTMRGVERPFVPIATVVERKKEVGKLRQKGVWIKIQQAFMS